MFKEVKDPSLGRRWNFSSEKEVREALRIANEIANPHGRYCVVGTLK